MWKTILIYLAIIKYLSRFVNGSEDIHETSGIIIGEVCLPQQIAELERYLDEFDPPEVPISNTATYQYLSIDDGAVAELEEKLPPQSVAVKEIELIPLGALPVDLKRLRILHDLLILPEDDELKSKLLIIYKILIAANQRVRKSARKTISEETHTQRIEAAENTPNYFGDEKIDSSRSEKAEERRNFLTTSRLQRSERSTYNQNYGYTDSSNPKYEKEGRASSSFSSSFSSPRIEATLNSNRFPETAETLNFDDENLGRYGEIGGKSNPESVTVIPKTEKVEEIFKDSESGGGIIGSFDRATKAENHQLETTDSSLEKISTNSNLKIINTDSNFQPTVTDSNFKETIIDAKFEKNFTDPNLEEINTDSTLKSTLTDSNFGVAVTDLNFKDTVIDSKFEESFIEPNSKETSTDSTLRSTFTDSNFGVTVTESNFKETITDPKFERSFTDPNLKGINTDSTPKSTFTDSNFGVVVSDPNLEESITDAKFEGSSTDPKSEETNTDSTLRITLTDSNFEVAVTDSNFKETITDAKFEGSLTDPNLEEINTDSTPKSTLTDSNFKAVVTDSNFKETMIDSKFEERFTDQNSRGTSTSINSGETVTDSSLKSTVIDLKLINTVTDSNLGEILTDTNLKEAIIDSKSIKMVTEYPTSELNYIELSTVENLHSKKPEDELIKAEEDYEKDSEEAKVTGFENRKSSEHVASETINEMRSPSPEGEVTTKEIKPDVENEDLETRITTLSDPFIRSSLLLPIDQKTKRYFGVESSPPRYFTTPSYLGDKNLKISLNYNKGLNNLASNSLDKEDVVASTTTKKTFILNIAESFSNIPRPVEVALLKKKDRKSGNHIFGMRNYEVEKNSRIMNQHPQGTGFYQRNRHRIGQESGGKLSANKLYGFKNFRRTNNSTGRHVKRGGHNTDVVKLYRWFYRGGDIPGKSAPGNLRFRISHYSDF